MFAVRKTGANFFPHIRWHFPVGNVLSSDTFRRCVAVPSFRRHIPPLGTFRRRLGDRHPVGQHWPGKTDVALRHPHIAIPLGDKKIKVAVGVFTIDQTQRISRWHIVSDMPPRTASVIAVCLPCDPRFVQCIPMLAAAGVPPYASKVTSRFCGRDSDWHIAPQNRNSGSPATHTRLIRPRSTGGYPAACSVYQPCKTWDRSLTVPK